MPNYDCGSPECMTCDEAFRRGKSDGSSPDGSSLPANREIEARIIGFEPGTYYSLHVTFAAPLDSRWAEGRYKIIGPLSDAAAAPETAAERDRLRFLLKELHALVWGECPSLLNEDSGGDARLDSEIRTLIAKVED